MPIGIVSAILSARLITESKAERAGAFDIVGAVLVTAGLMVLVYAIVKAEAFGWGSLRTLGLAAVGIVLLVVFVYVERRTEGPLVRLEIFKIRSLAVANTVLRAGRRRPVRDVLLRVAVRPGDPGLQRRSRPASRSCR